MVKMGRIEVTAVYDGTIKNLYTSKKVRVRIDRRKNLIFIA